MKTIKLFMSVAVLALLFSFVPSGKTHEKKKCPLVQLASPPSVLEVGTPRLCENTLTVNTTYCSPFTFYFTWAGGSYSPSTAPGSGVLNFNLPAMPSGTIISLVVFDNAGGSSVTYYFTATTTCF